MRRLVLVPAVLSAFALALPAHAEPYPAASGFVVDTAGVIPPAAEAVLEGELRSYSDRTTNQIGVAVINDLGGEAVEDYARGLFNAWGVGQAGKDNGVLILLAVHDRRSRIQVGYGLEGALPQATTDHVLAAQLTPRARAGDIAGAVTATERALRAVLGDVALAQAPADESAAFGGGAYEDAPPDLSLVPDGAPTVQVVPAGRGKEDGGFPALWLLPGIGAVAVVVVAVARGGGGGPGHRRSRTFGSGYAAGGCTSGYDGGGSGSSGGGGDFGGGSSGDSGSSGSF